MNQVRRFFFFLCVLFLSAAASLHAQYNDTLSTGRMSSFEGYHFFVAYMQNDNFIQPSGLRLRLMMCSAYPATITVRFNKDSSVVVKLPANTATTLLVPSRMEVRADEIVSDSVVEVASDVPISVYAMSSQPFSSDSYAVIPVSNWGTEYTVLSMANDGYGVGNDSNFVMLPEEIRQSEFMIIAAADNTIAEFNPTYQTQRGAVAGQWQSVKLNKGQCYLVKAAPIKPLSGDLTGSRVRANQPIAVISGHARSAVPQALVNVTDSKDHLAEWLIPDRTLSNEYISVPFYTDARIPVGDVIRIVATQPQTSLLIYTEREDLTYTLKNAGDIQTLKGVDSPCWIRSTKPVSVGQYMLTGWAGGSISYDPSLVIVPPANKFVSRAVFQVPNNIPEPFWASQFQQHYVNILCDSMARYSMKLDGVNIGKNIAPELLLNKFRSSPYFWARVAVSPGKHELSCDTFGFSGTLYGMGNTDSYAHTLGFSMLPEVRDTIAPYFSVQGSCGQLSGTVNEVVNAYSTSLAYVVYEPDSTKNFGFLASSVQQSPNQVTFSAHVLDPKKDGQISIVARDIAGNGRRYRYYYHAPRFTYTASVLMSALTENDSMCARVYVQSPSSQDTLFVRSARLSGSNSSLKLWPPSAYPIQILPKTGVDFQLCFKPGGQSAMKINDTIVVDLGCGVQLRIPVKATTPTSALFVSDIDFGDVRVGEQACQNMRIINTGSRTATLTTADFDQADVQLSTADLAKLPKTLVAGDSFIVRICYTPKDTSNILRALIFHNSLGEDVRGELTGRGIQVFIDDTDIDMGSRRIVTAFDSVIIVHNRGNVAAKLTYTQQSGNAAQFLHSFGSIKTFTIAAGDSAALGVRFYPKLVGNYSSALNFSVDDRIDSTFVMKLHGRGTVPVDSVRDVSFDTIQTNRTKSIKQACIYSKGTEALSVDTISLGGPDMFSFVVNIAQLRSRVVGIGDSVQMDIQFHPTRAGRHDAVLSVTHDADQAYLRKQSVIHLVGWARDSSTDTTHSESPKDTAAPKLSIQMPTLVYACDSVPVLIRLSNRDTANLTIRSYTVDNTFSNEASFGSSSSTALPAGQTFSISHIYQGPLKNGQLRLRIQCNTWKWDTTLSVKIQQRILTIDSVRQLSLPRAGDSVGLRISGHVDGEIKAMAPFELHLPIDHRLFDVRRFTTVLTGGPTIGQFPCSVSQTAQEVVIRSTGLFATSGAGAWSTDLSFLTLISEVGSCSGTVSALASPCYSVVEAQSELLTDLSCAGTLRPVNLKGISIQGLYPQPAGDKLTLLVKALNEDEKLRISLIDVLGRKFILMENLFLLKDDNSLILDLKAIPSGLYRLELQTRDDLEQLPIMLTK